MQKIEINTAHNITISTTLGSTMERFLATVIDLFVIGGWLLLSSVFIGSSSILFYLLAFPVSTFYHLGFEIFNNGQSIGKKAMALRVVTERGTTPTINAYFMRWTFRMIDILGSLGTVAILFVMSTAKKQRIGDMIAQTLVIKIKDDQFIDLKQLESFYATKKEFLFPQVVRYNDEDMLTVKESIERYKKYPNPSSRSIVHSLYQRIIEELDVDKSSFKNEVQFLEWILEEYILLTR